ncbi:MAG: LPXTG cell wall anchor domain-containing protein [Mogibacterium sp.]|nr:LPXTG cell wall anchor domain-containing protein [Mogibacterium sp.]
MKIKNKIICLCITAVLVLGSVAAVFGETYQSPSGWKVSFTQNKKMSSNFSSKDIANTFAKAEPGDTVIVTVSQTNNYNKETRWYMNNKVIKTLEDVTVAYNGAYSYKLEYVSPAGATTVLYDSNKVGGQTLPKVGLKEATNSLEEWFYMDTLQTGQTSKVILTMKIDGNAQGNYYQNTLAAYQLAWAVELDGTLIVDTGDTTNMLLWAGITLVCGLGIVVILMMRRRKESSEGGR